MQKDDDPGLVPELLVTDLDVSVRFWCGLCGFAVRYERPEERFAYIAHGSAHVMLEQANAGRNWLTARLDVPFGRGVNLQVAIPDVAPLLLKLRFAGVDLFMQPESKWYRAGDEEVGVVQFLVADPDGYLIRF